MLNQAETERFYQKFVAGEKDSCWNWAGAKYQNGYGMFCLRRGKRKTFSAHRISWILANSKDIPSGMMICHTCDNRLCINPNHLYMGSGKDNNTDTVKRNRGNRLKGEQCSWAKLTEENVRHILVSELKQVELAKMYGILPSTVSQIKSGKRWKHLFQELA